MKKRIAKKWAAALRSGKYQQGVGGLKSGDAYCCLGVLCDLYAKEKKVRGFSKRGAFRGSVAVLPPVVQRWAGLRSSHGRLPSPALSLSEANDLRVPFEQIARMIEENVDKL